MPTMTTHHNLFEMKTKKQWNEKDNFFFLPVPSSGYGEAMKWKRALHTYFCLLITVWYTYMCKSKTL